jgi:serine/threonine protein phosphatase 1
MNNYWFIGDIHGEIGLLDSLLEVILEHNPREIIFVGDYIDRGPHSKEVIDRLMELEIPAICLMGNHELMMLSALEDFAFAYNPMELWYHNGAEATLQSFGFSGFFSFQSQLESRYLQFFQSLRMSHVVEPGAGLRILATHAGVSPSIPVAEQLLLKDYQDLQQYVRDNQLDPGDSFLWARESFFNSPSSLWKGYMVVHGHTPTSKLKYFIQKARDPNFQFIDDDLLIRRDGKYGEVVSVGIDSGSTISGRLSGIGIFADQGEGSRISLSMRSLTVSRKDIIPRDLGPIRP